MSSSYDAAMVDTAMIEDPRLLKLAGSDGRSIRLVYLEAIVWAKLHRTDGFIPTAALRRLTDEDDTHKAAAALIDVGAWEAASGGWQIIGFTDSQMSAERVKTMREAARIRYDRWNKRVANGVANGADRLPARPPARKGKGGGGGQGIGESPSHDGQHVDCAVCAPLQVVQ